MARPVSELHRPDKESTEATRESWLTRTTARAFAAAVSSLLIATLVINRSSEALTTDGTVAGSAVSSGTVSLVDDDQGRSLFDLSDMSPQRPVIRCIEVVYDGTILPVDLALKAESVGSLSAFLDVSIEEGTGGSFETCDGFSAQSNVFSGTLAELSAGGWRHLDTIVNTGARRTFRIEFALQDEQDALGLTTSADFTWEVEPS